MARRAIAFGMRVLAYDPFVPEQSAGIAGRIIGLDELAERSDFITVHMPLTDQTRDMINAESIARMKDGVFLVNCARGGIINETDIVGRAGGKVGGCALDVYETEPCRRFAIAPSPIS